MQATAFDTPPLIYAAPIRASMTSANVFVDIFLFSFCAFSALAAISSKKSGRHFSPVKGLSRMNLSTPLSTQAPERYELETLLSLERLK